MRSPTIPSLTSNPDILYGEVCFTGTRIPVATVWSYLATGHTAPQIVAEYPTLTLLQVSQVAGMVNWATPTPGGEGA